MNKLDAFGSAIYLGLSGLVLSIFGVFIIGVIANVGSAAPEHLPSEVPATADVITSVGSGTPESHMMGGMPMEGMTMPTATPAPNMMGGTPAPTATPAPNVATPASGELSKVAELHHWIAHKAVAAQNDEDVVYHLEKALALATGAEQKSLLEGLLREYRTGGQSTHVSDTIKRIMESAGRSQPDLAFESLHASLVYVLLEEGDITEARAQMDHLEALATGTVKGQVQKIIEAHSRGDIETAKKLAAELIVAQQLEMEHAAH